MTEFKLPELGENIDQGDLVRLMVSLGASVTEGQPVMELETDKAVVEVPSSVTGTVNEIRVKEGQKVKVGQVIFTVENGAGAKAKAVRSRKPVEAKAAKPKPDEAKTAAAKAPRRKSQRRFRKPATPPVSQPPAPAAPVTAAPSDFRLPELGENIDQGDLVRLMISPGSKVSEGQPVMELETDKAVVEVPSSVTGTVKEIQVKEGQKIKVGQVIFTLEGGASPPPEKSKHAPVEHISEQHEARLSVQAAIAAEGKTPAQVFLPDQPQPHAPKAFAMPEQLGKVAGTEHRAPAPAAPHVRRLAREVGVDIYDVKGTGPGGRISEDDVKARAKALLTSAAAAGSSRRGTPVCRSLSCRISPNSGKSNASPCAACGARPPSICGRPGPPFRTSPSRTKPTSPNWSNCAPASRPRRRKPAAR